MLERIKGIMASKAKSVNAEDVMAAFDVLDEK